jgi:hypothetical protein
MAQVQDQAAEARVKELEMYLKVAELEKQQAEERIEAERRVAELEKQQAEARVKELEMYLRQQTQQSVSACCAVS